MFQGSRLIQDNTSFTTLEVADKNGSQSLNVLMTMDENIPEKINISVLASPDNNTYFETYSTTMPSLGTASEYISIDKLPTRYIKIKVTNNSGNDVTLKNIYATWVKGI